MHELGVALELVDALADRAGGARVQRVVLEVGVLSSVLPDALAFCFELATRGTPVEGAHLELRAVPGHARCRSCGAELRPERMAARCGCGAYDLEWLSGEALEIVEMEVA
jgi:hydrogenase nickel incorporation protein HypA/HybF